MNALFMKPVVLQINKEVEHNAVVELVDHIFFTGVDDLHLIAEIHIDLLRELAIKSETIGFGRILPLER